MKRLRSLLRDERGSPVIEFAIAVPTLVSIIYGIAQLGFIYEANAGMQHALGQGARFGTLFDPTKCDFVHTNAEILAEVDASLFGKGSGAFASSIPTSGTGYVDVRVTYTKKLDFLFMTGPTVTLTRSKRVYVPSATTTTCT